ncbi:MAG: phosphatidate cytidylyltransferase [Planctomycetes bacterium]|nr:phosphatidate cytidylyltransferase [Planctomycetota bacterium]
MVREENYRALSMGQRIAFGTLAILVLLAIFQIDVQIAIRITEGSEQPQSTSAVTEAIDNLLERGSVLPLFFLLVASWGAVEFRRLLSATGAKPCAIFAHLMIALLVLTPWLSAAGWLGSGPAEFEGLYWQIVWLVVAGVGTAFLIVIRGQPSGALRDVGATAALIFCLGFLPSFGLQLRCSRDIPDQQGAWLLLVTLLVIKASDIGAYFVGSTFGRHRLLPSVSPAKSVEGLVGGFAASALLAVAFAHLDWLGAQTGLDPAPRAQLGRLALLFGNYHQEGGFSLFMRAIIFGIAMSAIAQLGDLLESCFKRDAEIKDSGRVIPTFGGILDLIDSPVLAMPVAWLLLRVVWRVV